VSSIKKYGNVLLLLLAFVALASTFLLVRIDAAREIRSSLVHVEKLGGEFVFFKNGELTECPATLYNCMVYEVHAVNLGGTDATNDDMAVISSLSNLRVLWLADTAIDDNSVTVIAKFRSLEELDLAGTQMSPAGIAKIQKSLPGTSITTEHVRQY
jgi:hypothetical protein